MPEEKANLLSDEQLEEMQKRVNEGINKHYIDMLGDATRPFLAGVQYVINLMVREASSLDEAFYAVDERAAQVRKEQAQRMEQARAKARQDRALIEGVTKKLITN